MTKTFDEVISGVRTAKKGVEVREDLAQMGEYCKRFADEAQGYATNAKASEKKATDAVAGIEQTKTDAVQAVQNAQTTATTAVQNAQTTATTAVQQAQSTATDAVAAKQTEAVQAVGTAKNEAVAAVDSERDAALQQVANSTKTAQTAASDAAASEQAASESKTAAATSAEGAANSATAASGSASAAAASETNASQSAENSEASAVRSEAAAKKAEAVVGTDKTLTVSGAPADAAATGAALATKANKDVILDDEGNVLFYSKTAVDELLAKKLDLTGGMMSGNIVFGSSGFGVGFSLPNGTEYLFRPYGGSNVLQMVCRNSKENIDWYGALNFNPDYSISAEGYLNGNKVTVNLLYGIVASGSNYVRFGDGTQICWGVFKFTALAFSEIAFPIAFSRQPSVSIMRFSSPNNSDTKGVFVATSINTTSFTFIASDGSNSSWLAIGRWK